jgi:hypothetical protein
MLQYFIVQPVQACRLENMIENKLCPIEQKSFGEQVPQFIT